MTILRFLLFPFAWLYGLGVSLRHFLYDKGIFKSNSFDIPIISVGNLSMGGSGKTPMIEYLIALLQANYQICTLSRGYRRRSRGFMLADDESTALELGDEPMQFKHKFPNINVAVGEDRVMAVPEILYQQANVNLILLDDAFQHRALQPSLQILLTSYNRLYTDDYLFPAGGLRDIKKAAQRADAIVVTKCPDYLGQQEAKKLRDSIAPLSHQSLFFSRIEYGKPYHLFDTEKKLDWSTIKSALLVCGIAYTTELESYLKQQVNQVETLYFGDHHYFKSRDLKKMGAKRKALSDKQSIIITTEKDAMRLLLLRKELEKMQLSIYVLPIETAFIEPGNPESKTNFSEFIKTFLDQLNSISASSL